jgi:hypothetical protein
MLYSETISVFEKKRCFFILSLQIGQLFSDSKTSLQKTAPPLSAGNAGKQIVRGVICKT